jgi:hypothetical protein
MREQNSDHLSIVLVILAGLSIANASEIDYIFQATDSVAADHIEP